MKKDGGFSLIETLIVVAIMSILMGLAAGGLKGVIRASSVSDGITLVKSQLSLARQTALVTNREVEVRFYRYLSPPSTTREFRAFQLMVSGTNVDPDSNNYTTPGTDSYSPEAIAIERIRKLPDGVVFLGDPLRSGLVGEPNRKGKSVVNIFDNTNAEYAYFRFKPDGSTDLALDQDWYLTIGLEDEAIRNKLVNYGTMEIDPATGQSSWMRP